MKKFLALTLLSSFVMSTTCAPSFAILDKKVKTQHNILEAVNIEWWNNFNDECLKNYIDLAIKNNHDIKTTLLKLEQANINVMMARSGQMPSLSVGASPVLAKMPNTTSTEGTFAIPLIAQYELDIFGKNWDKTKSAKKLYQGAEFKAKATEISIISMVGTTYYNIVKLDKIIEIQEKLTQDRKEIYELMKISNQEGIVSTSDLILSEKQYVLAQNDLLDYQNARQQALNALAVLISDSPNNISGLKRISFDELSNDFNIPDEIPSDVIMNRPDYKAIEKELESAGIDVRVAKKEFLPSFNIIGLLSFMATSASGNMDWKNAFSILGMSANLPIFTGFKRVANLKLNQNRYKQLLEHYQKTNLISIQEVNNALYNFKTNNSKLTNNTLAYNIQKKDFENSTAKYNYGVISKLDLLQQKEALLYMEKLATASKIDCYIDKISLYKATGAKLN